MGYISLCAWREARGEGNDGMRGVIHVIGNRVATWYWKEPEPWHYAIFYHGQFTSMSDDNDPQFFLKPAADDPQYLYCTQVAPLIVAGKDFDLTNGSLYYANLSEIPKGGWFDKYIVQHPETHPVLAVIAHTTFFA